MTFFVNAGFDLSRKQSSTNLQQAEGFPSDKMTDIIFARQYLKDAKPKGTEETVKDFGYYLSANYSYDNRLNFDATFRQSASSMYGANSRWGEILECGRKLEHTQRELDGRFQHHPIALKGNDRLDWFPKLGSL